MRATPRCVRGARGEDLVARLTALVPPPRMHLLHYFGVLAPNARLRKQVVLEALEDTELDRAQAEAFLVKFSLRTGAQAAQCLRFIDTYRSYVINYNQGEQLLRQWVERQGEPQVAVGSLRRLIFSPRLPRTLGP